MTTVKHNSLRSLPHSPLSYSMLNMFIQLFVDSEHLMIPTIMFMLVPHPQSPPVQAKEIKQTQKSRFSASSYNSYNNSQLSDSDQSTGTLDKAVVVNPNWFKTHLSKTANKTSLTSSAALATPRNKEYPTSIVSFETSSKTQVKSSAQSDPTIVQPHPL